MNFLNSSPLDINTWIQLNKSAWVFTMNIGELNE